MTAEKHYKWCFHLLYVFDEVIYGENYFNAFFDTLAEDIPYDNQARDPHRCIFTSNTALPNYVCRETGFIYSTSKLKKYIDDNPNIYPVTNSRKKKGSKKEHDYKVTINETFLSDFKNMERRDFIKKYMTIFPYTTETYIDPSLYNNGYADLRNTPYYTVPSAKSYWNKELKSLVDIKVIKGHRNAMILPDTLAFMKIFPNMTIEHLIYCLACQTYKYYDNSDGKMTMCPDFILHTATRVYQNPEKYDFEPYIRKKFKIDQQYWIDRGHYDWLEVTNIIRRMMKDDDLGSMYDFSKTLEENLKDFRSAGLNTSRRTLMQWLKDKGYDYCTDKDMLKMKVRELHYIQPELTFREIAKETGISPATVCRYLKDKE
jgi:hypothetical protein